MSVYRLYGGRRDVAVSARRNDDREIGSDGGWQSEHRNPVEHVGQLGSRACKQAPVDEGRKETLCEDGRGRRGRSEWNRDDRTWVGGSDECSDIPTHGISGHAGHFIVPQTEQKTVRLLNGGRAHGEKLANGSYRGRRVANTTGAVVGVLQQKRPDTVLRKPMSDRGSADIAFFVRGGEQETESTRSLRSIPSNMAGGGPR
jgi:hypothetical protein